MGEGGGSWKQKFWYKEFVFLGRLLHITPCQSLIIRASFGPPIGRGPKDPLCLSVWLDVGGWENQACKLSVFYARDRGRIGEKYSLI